MADFFVTSSKFPDPPEGKVAAFRDLSGGLNLWQMPYRMDAEQSPEMKNLWWRDGLLTCRDGQEYVSDVGAVMDVSILHLKIMIWVFMHQ